MVIVPDSTSKTESDSDLAKSTISDSDLDDAMSVDPTQARDAISFHLYHVPSVDISDPNDDPQTR